MSEKCLKCFRPLSTCYCSSIKTLETDVKFIFLMHPKEAYHQHTGTGRLACLSLKDAEIIVGIDFTHNAKLNRLLSDPDFFPMVLYPGEDSVCGESIADGVQEGGDSGGVGYAGGSARAAGA